MDPFDFLDWIVLHREAVFTAFLVLMGLRLIVGVGDAAHQGVRAYKAAKLRQTPRGLT